MAIDEPAIPATPTLLNTTKDQMDSSNPYFLHHSDNSGMRLVSQDLTGDNFNSWHLAMTIALNAKNKLCFVDGSKPMPSADATDFQVWKRCNDMVKSWLIAVISTNIANSVLYVSNAEDIWKQLRERFAQSNAPRLYQLRRDIALCSQESQSIAAYYTKLKSLWDELSSLIAHPTCSCDSSKAFQTYQQQASLIDFLMGLNESYNSIRGQILLMEPLPTVNKAYALLLQEEKQRSVSVNHSMWLIQLHFQYHPSLGIGGLPQQNPLSTVALCIVIIVEGTTMSKISVSF
ncbi:hypothetical protein ACHQM5_006950 [Ranunculus cassubicifolius]